MRRVPLLSFRRVGRAHSRKPTSREVLLLFDHLGGVLEETRSTVPYCLQSAANSREVSDGINGGCLNATSGVELCSQSVENVATRLSLAQRNAHYVGSFTYR
jgi:hypothetical protein